MAKCKPGITDADVARALANMIGNIIEFCPQKLQEIQPRRGLLGGVGTYYHFH